MSHGICPGCRQAEDECQCDAIEHPNHYTSGPPCPGCGRTIECIDITKHMGFIDGNAMKYLWRYQHKGVPLQDLKKSRQYLDWLIESYEEE